MEQGETVESFSGRAEAPDAPDASDAQETSAPDTDVRPTAAPMPDDAAPASDATLSPDQTVRLNGKAVPLSAVVESLLFVADTPVEPLQIAKALDISRQDAEDALARLDRSYREDGRGLRLLARDDTYQLVTMPEAAVAIETFLSLDLTAKLSGPALEVLAVIAYRQPVTRVQIEAVRGVDCAGVLRSLLQRGLVEEIGRMETVGRPILYGITDLFMQHFGLTALGELPPLEDEAADTLWVATELAEDAGPGQAVETLSEPGIHDGMPAPTPNRQDVESNALGQGESAPRPSAAATTAEQQADADRTMSDSA